MTPEERRKQAKLDAQERAEQERRIKKEREAMRRMGAPRWAIALRVDQIED